MNSLGSRFGIHFSTAVVIVMTACGVGTRAAAAQAPQTPIVAPPPPAAPRLEPLATPDPERRIDSMIGMSSRRAQEIVRIGQDYRLGAGEQIRQAVIILGSGTIAGEVHGDVVVVLGRARLEPTAIVHGSLVVVAGGADIEQGAAVHGDLVVTGGGVLSSPDFSPGGEQVVVGLSALNRRIESTIPWLTRGLLWGRLIVPGLAGMWTVVAIVVLVYLVLALSFRGTVQACRQMLVDRPMTTFLVGLLVLVLLGPIAFVLAVSVVGIPVLPVLACGLLIALLLGKLGVTRWVGGMVLTESEPDSGVQALRSFAIGTVLVVLAYMVPLLGLATWALLGVLGLGAAALAFFAALAREHPAKVVASPPVSGPAVPNDSSRPSPMAAVPSAEAIHVPAPSLLMDRAPFMHRAAAFAVDLLLVAVTFVLLGLSGLRAYVGLFLVYHVVCWTLRQGTVGAMVCNLRVVRTDGEPMSVGDAVIRAFAKMFSVAALGVGCFWALFDPEQQTWHDRIAGTYVVRVTPAPRAAGWKGE